MNIDKPLSELEVLEKLTELCEHIDKNNWEHLYAMVDAAITSRSLRLADDVHKLNKELTVLKNSSKAIEEKYSQMRIKLLAFKHLLKEIPE